MSAKAKLDELLESEVLEGEFSRPKGVADDVWEKLQAAKKKAKKYD